MYDISALAHLDALKELSKKYNEKTQVFEDLELHARLHELSPLEAVREFTDLHKPCLNRKAIKKNEARKNVR